MKPGCNDQRKGSARAEDAQGTPTQSHISPSTFSNTKIIQTLGGMDHSRVEGSGSQGAVQEFGVQELRVRFRGLPIVEVGEGGSRVLVD